MNSRNRITKEDNKEFTGGFIEKRSQGRLRLFRKCFGLIEDDDFGVFLSLFVPVRKDVLYLGSGEGIDL